MPNSKQRAQPLRVGVHKVHSNKNMKKVLLTSTVLAAGACAYSGWDMYQFYDTEFNAKDDFKPFLLKLRPGLVVGPPRNTNRSINVNYGPFSELQAMHAEIEKEWHWDKPQRLTLRVKKRNYESDWQIQLED
jgi:hypothetical protein